jgi:hypothetical protein
MYKWIDVYLCAAISHPSIIFKVKERKALICRRKKKKRFDDDNIV